MENFNLDHKKRFDVNYAQAGHYELFEEKLSDLNLVQMDTFPTWSRVRMLKAPSVNPRVYTFSVLKCNCWVYDDIFGQIFQNPRFATKDCLKT